MSNQPVGGCRNLAHDLRFCGDRCYTTWWDTIVTSPTARLLALQCALRADVYARVRLPTGLLLGMRLRGRREVWEELADSGWMEMPDLKPACMEVRLLDAAILEQVPGRGERRRAAHWALRPTPMLLPPAAPLALRLTALVLAAHTSGQAHHSIDMDALARLCGHSPRQMAELLDRLTRTRILAAWHHRRDTDEVLWQLLNECAPLHGTVRLVQRCMPHHEAQLEQNTSLE